MDCNFVPVYSNSAPQMPGQIFNFPPFTNVGMEYQPLCMPVYNMRNEYPRCVSYIPPPPYGTPPAHTQGSAPLVCNYGYIPLQIPPPSSNPPLVMANLKAGHGPFYSESCNPALGGRYNLQACSNVGAGFSGHVADYEANAFLPGGAAGGSRTFSARPQVRKHWHCDICALPLTSFTQAEQHYNGRRHRLRAARISKPSGYYDDGGNWVPIEIKYKPKELWCKICSIKTPTKSHMDMHVLGARHSKNVKKLGLYETSADEELAQYTFRRFCESLDGSIFRSPVGFFCGMCDLQFTHIMCLKQHLEGKKHRIAAANGTPANV